VTNYTRELDISRAVHTLSFEYMGTVFKREYFISAPSSVFVIRLSAADRAGRPVPAQISFRAGLDRGVFYDRRGNGADTAWITRDEDIPFCAMIKAVHKNGSLQARGGFLTVTKADEALLFTDIRTGFREADYFSACAVSLDRVCTASWDDLLEEHINDYRSYYDRVKLDINVTRNESKTAETARKTVEYFNFSRYLLISSSRPGSLPANLQGIWNAHLDPPWGSDYTININTQMNYWPANMCGLAETEEPLFDLLERMYPNGKITARVMFGCGGFTAHHNTDIWGDTAPRDYWIPASYWVLGAAWLCLHIWEHYEYSQDLSFLKKYFYLLNEACLFFMDFLSPGKRLSDKGEPYLVVSPSASPENSYLLNGEACSLCAGAEMDNQILRCLFTAAVRASRLLGRDTSRLEPVLERLPSPIIHSNGTIREWNDEFEEAEPGHRHFSHLFALWPGDSITPDETPVLANAARKTLERRLSNSGGHTGWSRAWLVNFMARLGDGGAALDNLVSMFDHFTLPNMFNNGPPFQIDGNFGALCGITQMLFQSRIRYTENSFRVVLDILPALPDDWADGSLSGVRAKGNLELCFNWNNTHLNSLQIKNLNTADIPLLIRAPFTPPSEIVIKSGETKTI
jgi:alpha-L-fucosidase 2